MQSCACSVNAAFGPVPEGGILTKSWARVRQYAEALADADKCLEHGLLETGHRYRGEALLGLGRLNDAEQASSLASLCASGQPLPAGGETSEGSRQVAACLACAAVMSVRVGRRT